MAGRCGPLQGLVRFVRQRLGRPGLALRELFLPSGWERSRRDPCAMARPSSPPPLFWTARFWFVGDPVPLAVCCWRRHRGHRALGTLGLASPGRGGGGGVQVIRLRHSVVPEVAVGEAAPLKTAMYSSRCVLVLAWPCFGEQKNVAFGSWYPMPSKNHLAPKTLWDPFEQPIQKGESASLPMFWNLC